MTYTIVSPRVGTPGDTYTPVEGVNVEALLEHGFIREDGKQARKSVKTENTSEKE